VVVWQEGPSYGSGVLGQRYASSGIPLGPEFRVNTLPFGGNPSVGSDPSGNFIVAWEGEGGIFGQRYSSSGAPLGSEFVVAIPCLPCSERSPSVASDSSGNFVVVWASSYAYPRFNAIVGQRYASSGAALGSPFLVSAYEPAFQTGPAVATDASGNFVVVWSSYGQDGSSEGVFGQRYLSSGTRLGPEFRVNSDTQGPQDYPSIAADGAGNFVVVWASGDGSSFGVFGQRYASSGAPLGSEFRVNTYTTSVQYRPSVAADSFGNFVVVWDTFMQDGDNRAVFGQRYASSGIPLGAEFLVNTYTTSSQARARVASDSTGRFVVVWNSLSQDGSEDGVFGQRYSMIVPVELMHFRVE
jgi:hypothetical protein